MNRDGSTQPTNDESARPAAVEGPDVPGDVQQHLCRLVCVERPARDLTLVRMEGVRVEGESRPSFTFAAGQYARVSFQGLPARDYSMANRPDERVLEFHIRDPVPGERPRPLHERLRPGDPAVVEGPFGDSWLREEHAGPIVAVAGGSGLAPVKSIVETALSRGMSQAIHIYLGVRDEPDLYLARHFEALEGARTNLRFVPVLSAAGPQAPRRAGLVSDAVAEDFGDLRGWKAYVFGPPMMVEATLGVLRRLGVEPNDIHGDSFAPGAR